MKVEEVEKLIDEDILKACKDIRLSKGESYSGQIDKLGNFKRCAELVELPIEKVWFVYTIKHFDALNAYIRGEYKDSESIKTRIYDLINYLFLLYAILKEQNKL